MSKTNKLNTVFRRLSRAFAAKDEKAFEDAMDEIEEKVGDEGEEVSLPAPAGDVDNVHGAVALAGDEQFVAAIDHVHRLAADLHRLRLGPE